MDEAIAPGRDSVVKRLATAWTEHIFLWVWVALAALIVVTAIVAPTAARPETIKGSLPGMSFLAIATMGQTIVLISRGIDLSVAGIVTLGAFVVVHENPQTTGGLILMIFIALALTTLAGTISGMLIGFLRLNAIIVTLGMNAVVLGAALIYTKGIPHGRAHPELVEAMFGRFLGIPIPLLIALALALSLTAVLRLSAFGRRFIFNGANAQAARVAGIRGRRYEITAYAVAGLLYGIAGVMIAGYVKVPSIDVGDQYLFGTIAAAVLAGTALSGGSGSLIAAIGGAWFLTQVNLLINALDYSNGISFIAQAIIIVVSLAVRRGRGS